MTLPEVETTAQTPCDPSGNPNIQPHRGLIKKSRSKMHVEECRQRLTLALDDVINHALDNTAQLSIYAESDDRTIPRLHFKSRFPFF